MRTTPFICQITALDCEISKMLSDMAYYLDQKNFVSAAICLGNIEAKADALKKVCLSTKDALWEDSQE